VGGPFVRTRWITSFLHPPRSRDVRSLLGPVLLGLKPDIGIFKHPINVQGGGGWGQFTQAAVFTGVNISGGLGEVRILSMDGRWSDGWTNVSFERLFLGSLNELLGLDQCSYLKGGSPTVLTECQGIMGSA